MLAFPLMRLGLEVGHSHRRDFSATEMCLRFAPLQYANLSDCYAALFTRTELILGLPLPQDPLQLGLHLRRKEKCAELAEALQQR